MNDDIDEGVELSEDACRRIGEAADELIDVCDEECANPQEMLNALSATLAYILCENVVSKEVAITAIQIFANSTLESINAAEADNNVAWRQARH